MKTILTPQDFEIEKAVLGAILLKGALIMEAKELTPEDFHNKDHATIFKTFMDLHDLGIEIDPLTVSNRANGLAPYIRGLAADVWPSGSLASHVLLLREYKIKRKVLTNINSIKGDILTLSASELSDRILKLTQLIDFNTEKHREINLTHEIEKWVSVTSGNFSVTDCYTELQGVTGITKRNNYRVILNRLKDRGIIQRVGDRDGVFRRVDDVAEEIDWFNAATNALDISFPLEVHKYVATYPRNIIIIAGEPNSGKTAFMLNVALLNMKRHKTTYLSSEMGAIELKNRLLKFSDIPLKDWKKIKFKERSSNFSDVVDPEGLTLIDFLEINDDFYRIGALLKEVYDKLTSGVCVIALQKNKGKEFGRGGEMGLEKPRLYLAMEPGKIKVIKAKAWAKEGVNPNGLQREFKLVQGAKFISESSWHKEGEI